MTYQAKLTSKGQITLPAALRKELGLKTGDRIDFRRTEQGNFEVVAKRYTLDDLRGILKHDGPPLSTQDVVDLVHAARRGEGEEFLEERKAGKTS
ncbi:MAG: AbrB/MazE/SpoVT family DNA-binding domain-containing protein [Ahrensia sp.]|nr:AbrB/MazE/SpoVT family DNA-binding domain-containing protein [Ahrensia sp.]